MRNQSLLDALLCLSRVVVPMARCFSSDSYGGSVTTRSTDVGRQRAQPLDGVGRGRLYGGEGSRKALVLSSFKWLSRWRHSTRPFCDGPASGEVHAAESAEILRKIRTLTSTWLGRIIVSGLSTTLNGASDRTRPTKPVQEDGPKRRCHDIDSPTRGTASNRPPCDCSSRRAWPKRQ